MDVPTLIPTRRLVLRRHRMEDLPRFAQFMTDPVATRYLVLPDHQRTVEGAGRRLAGLVASYESTSPVFCLAIADRDTDCYLGTCGLDAVSENAVAVYYTVVAEAQGQGYATEATAALVQHAFSALGVDVVEAYVFADNVPSVRVLEKLGFVDEGPHVHRGLQGRVYRLTAKAGAAGSAG